MSVNFADLLGFGFSTKMDGLSWLLLLSMIAKALSTGLLLIHVRIPFMGRRTAAWLWWTTKLSALSLCAAAFAISRLSSDSIGASVFGGLFVIAVLLVLWRVFRRLKTEPQRPFKHAS